MERGDARAAARALEALGLRVDETLAAVVEAALGGGLLRRSALTALATARSLPADAEGAFLAAPAPTQVQSSLRSSCFRSCVWSGEGVEHSSPFVDCRLQRVVRSPRPKPAETARFTANTPHALKEEPLARKPAPYNGPSDSPFSLLAP